jgi:hypothetical protein
MVLTNLGIQRISMIEFHYLIIIKIVVIIISIHIKENIERIVMKEI